MGDIFERGCDSKDGGRGTATLAVFLLLCVITPIRAHACLRTSPVDPVEMVREADAIVVARAVEAVVPPPNPLAAMPRELLIRFEVDEWVKGELGTSLTLPGSLVSYDDFNERPVPYDFVRRDGRSGSCFASSYKSGGTFLLFVRLQNGAPTVRWYALGPTNEQLRDDKDPWLLWVREAVAALQKGASFRVK